MSADDPRVRQILVELSTKVTVLQQIIVILIAQAVNQSENVDEAFKALSNGLIGQIDEMENDFSQKEAPYLEKMRAEIDEILEAAQALLRE